MLTMWNTKNRSWKPPRWVNSSIVIFFLCLLWGIFEWSTRQGHKTTWWAWSTTCLISSLHVLQYGGNLSEWAMEAEHGALPSCGQVVRGTDGEQANWNGIRKGLWGALQRHYTIPTGCSCFLSLFRGSICLDASRSNSQLHLLKTKYTGSALFKPLATTSFSVFLVWRSEGGGIWMLTFFQKSSLDSNTIKHHLLQSRLLL